VTALLFVDLSSIAVLGLLLAFVIPSGKASMEAKVFLDLHRNKWVDIHVALSLTQLGLIAWHVWQSRDWLTISAKKPFGDKWRKALWVLSGAWLVVVFLGWLVFEAKLNSTFFSFFSFDRKFFLFQLFNKEERVRGNASGVLAPLTWGGLNPSSEPECPLRS
jgi:hypothetical protein